MITSDGKKAGRVAEQSGDTLVVEQGRVFRHRRPLPRSFVSVDDDARVVRANVPKELLDEAPDPDDADAVARHYGLAGSDPDPVTHGRGEILPDDPATPAPDGVAERAALRERMGPGEGPNDGPPSIGGAAGGRLSEPRS